MASADESFEALDPEETERMAAQWGEWLEHDMAHFVGPLSEKLGLTRSEVLLYLISERLAQIAEVGVTVRLFARHDIRPLPPEDPGEEWKK
jgi:hypothetical protein